MSPSPDFYIVKQLRFILSAVVITIIYTSGMYHKHDVRHGPTPPEAAVGSGSDCEVCHQSGRQFKKVIPII